MSAGYQVYDVTYDIKCGILQDIPVI